MSPRKPSKDQIHEEMLRHLEQNPPKSQGPAEKPAALAKARAKKAEPPARPTLMLRRLRLELAIERLAGFVRFHAAQGTPEILVIVGKGRNSPGGEAVLGPAVRQWCERERRIRALREAGPREGGAGALILELKG